MSGTNLGFGRDTCGGWFAYCGKLVILTGQDGSGVVTIDPKQLRLSVGLDEVFGCDVTSGFDHERPAVGECAC